MDKNQRYQELASKWLNNTISEEEKKEFAAWYNDYQEEKVFIESEFVADEEEYRKHLLERIHRLIALSEKKRRNTAGNRKLWACLVAAVFFLVVLGIFLRPDSVYIQRSEMVDKDVSKKGVDPAKNDYGVTITVDDGRMIILDSLSVGEIVREKGVMIKKIAANVVLYTPRKEQTIEDSPVVYHTMKTPSGKDYHLILPDGSKIWLNARSELTYSAASGSKERRVKLNGEAYFVINHLAQDKIIPFIVESRLQEVSVLGTAFNINAYRDEEWISTTLVNGAVKVKQSQNDVTAVLKPDHQAVVGPNSTKIKIKKVDVSEIISWKDGYFNFHDSDIKTVLRQFARWYDVDVVYKRSDFADAYVGKIPKSLRLEEALSVLETVGVRFKIEGRKLIII